MFAFWHCFGVHAGESPDDILTRKRREIADNGWTLWSFSHKTSRTLDRWRVEIKSSGTAAAFVFCSLSRNAVDPKGAPAHVRGYRSPGQLNWQSIPDTIRVPHPFGVRETAAAFVVRGIVDRSEWSLPSAVEWLCMGQDAWRSGAVPTRGEYLLRAAKGTTLRPVAAVLELGEPFVVELRK